MLGSKLFVGTPNDLLKSKGGLVDVDRGDGISVFGITRDLVRFAEESVAIGGSGGYDERRVSARLSHTVSNVSSRRSAVESAGMLV